ncbi:hypothetical protein ILUMI_24346 [Ignelater luminosus]|uniref:C2H2-type domain-containing protein n=1 Tax=Ignelater luminosus TaxID=2038154 RepID=A0A8K0C791_IGNLU|nr:hypothetical protein ILUMI_24346 [Ignelater luminosus]
MLKKSPEYSNRATPETSTNFGHPPTPQSYHSASSPYQNPDNSTFSPGFQSYQPIKTERASPSAHYQQSYSAFPETQFFSMDNSQSQGQPGYPQDYPLHKMSSQHSGFRYHPYQQQNSYDRSTQSQVSSSSPAYPPQPTPSPSPKQCDKCGYVCESATLLIEHLNVVHPPTPAHMTPYQQNQHFMFGGQHDGKGEEDAQSEILDLDSHKVHQVYQEEEKRQNGEINGHNPHSVSAMLSSWPHSQQQNKFQQDQRMFMNGPEQKMYQNGVPHTMEGKIFPQDQKLFQPHQIHPAEYMANGVTTTTQDNASNNIVPAQSHTYRPFEHMAAQTTTPVITSTQVPNNPTPSNPPSGKGTNWKSNEARRPKTYNCTACNKWFTSSGHLKRHYNTTLHKNAVKSSGQPDPASLPISAHHHPGRDSCSNRGGDASPDPVEDSRGEDSQSNFERPGAMPGLLQQPPNGPYDRQPTPNMHSQPLHSPMGHNPNTMNSHNSLSSHSNLSNLSSGSPPNGEAGPSVTNLDTRGLLSLPSTPNPPFTTPGFSMAPMMPMDNGQFQMYPNGSAPHVTQVTATSSHNTTGELIVTETQQPLPSFAQFQAHRLGLLLSYDTANVGGAGPVTAPYTFYTEVYETAESRRIFRQEEDENLKATMLTASQPTDTSENHPYSPPHHNNNNSLSELQTLTENEEPLINTLDDLKIKFESQPVSPEKAHIKRDYEEGAGSPLISSTVQAKQPGLHKCFDCDKMFNKACYLTQHNKTFHSGDKPFKCGRCGKRFSCEAQYQEHSSKHAGEKPYKCDLCPKQFNHKTDLRRHMCLHTGQKPYACDTCGKGFIRKDHMLKHCETHAKKPHVSKVTAVR